MALPSPKFYNPAGDTEQTTHDFGNCDAGSYKPDATGWEVWIWNDKGGSLSSDDMTSIKISIRDADGGEDEVWTKQHWIEIKSYGISGSGIDDDAMMVFQSVGLNKELSLGDIPSNCARKLFIRCYPPTDAEEQNIIFQLKATYQKPATSICKWLTGLFGNGVVNTGNKLLVTDNAGADSVIDIASGYALIDDAEVYFGSTNTHTISTDAGVYKIYLTHTGVFGSTTGSIPTNSILLNWTTISGGVVTDVVDKRTFLFHSISRVVCQHFQDLLTADADGVHAAITGNGASQDITTGITNPDYARNASITTTNIATPSGNVTITGLVRGISDTDVIAIVASGTAYGVKAFDTITNINIPVGVSASDTVTVGFSDKMGLANSIAGASSVYKKKVNNEDKTSELAGNIDATYYTVDCATIQANEDMELRYNSILTL